MGFEVKSLAGQFTGAIPAHVPNDDMFSFAVSKSEQTAFILKIPFDINNLTCAIFHV